VSGSFAIARIWLKALAQAPASTCLSFNYGDGWPTKVDHLGFNVLTGDVPFRGDTPVATALARLKTPARDPCDLNRTLPLWLGEVVGRCLEREPRDRFGSVKQLVRALDAGEGEEVQRETVTISRPCQASSARSN